VERDTLVAEAKTLTVRLTRLQAELDGTLKDYAKLKEMVEKSGGSTRRRAMRPFGMTACAA
jgi:hypothetical protein